MYIDSCGKQHSSLFPPSLHLPLPSPPPGHLCLPELWAHRQPVLLHGVCLHLPPWPRLQLQEGQPHCLLRLLGAVPLPGPGPHPRAPQTHPAAEADGQHLSGHQGGAGRERRREERGGGSVVVCWSTLSPVLLPQLDSSHQHLVSVLMATVAHQSRAQSHWSAIRSTSFHSRSKHEDTPVHNLRPPKFAPKALTIVLEDWECVRTAILSGSGGAPPPDHTPLLGTVPLDATVYTLLAKLSQDVSEGEG